MIIKGERYRLLKRGYPLTKDLWFSVADAAAFEGTTFTSREDAYGEIRVLCDAADTLDDSNFDEFSPEVLTESEYFTVMDGDTSFNWY